MEGPTCASRDADRIVAHSARPEISRSSDAFAIVVLTRRARFIDGKRVPSRRCASERRRSYRFELWGLMVLMTWYRSRTADPVSRVELGQRSRCPTLTL